ncbi:MAG: CHAT domain-containing protein [Candidatus Polarisedimenticolia bacterium]
MTARAAVRLLSGILLFGSMMPMKAADDAAGTVTALCAQKKYAEAESAGRSFLAQAEREHGPGSPQAAAALDAIVSIGYASAGSWRPADILPLAERAVRIKEALPVPDEAGLALSLKQLAHSLAFLGRPVEAISLMTRVLDIREKLNGKDHPLVAEAHNNLAASLGAAGDYAAARPHFEDALAIYEKTLGPLHNKTQTTRFNLGKLLEALGDYEAARTFFEHVMNSRKIEPRPAGPGGPAGAMLVYGGLLRKMGEPRAAEPYVRRGLELMKEAHGPTSSHVGWALSSLARLYEDMGRSDEALPLYEESLRLLTGALGPRHPGVAEAMASLAALKAAAGDRAGALRLAEESLRIREENGSGPQAARAGTMLLLAALERSSGHARRALDLALEVEELIRSHFHEVARGLSQRQAFGYERIRTSGLDLALTLASDEEGEPRADSVRRIWDQLVQSRALVMDEMGIRRAAEAAGQEPGLENLAASLSTARTRLSQIVMNVPEQKDAAAHRTKVAQARSEKERAERELSEASARFRSLLAPGPGSLDEVARHLPARSVLVSYIVFERSGGPSRQESIPWYGALRIDSTQRQPAFVPLRPAAEIEQLVSAWRREVGLDPAAPYEAGGEARFRRAAAALRAAVWDPVAAGLQDARHVFIVPDGALQLVSFATLPLGEQRYLVDSDFDIHYLSAERDLARSTSSPPTKGLLILGAPDFDSRPGATSSAPPTTASRRRSPCDLPGSLRFEPLPGSRVEIERIESLWSERKRDGTPGMVTRLMGDQAGESRFKAQAGGHEVLHLATHGFFTADGCSSGTAETPAVAASLDDSLLTTGLALAGVNRRDEAVRAGEDDGILTAEEMASLDLSSTQWVVLSACETGLGRIVSGEGVLGMRRSLAIAGAGTVIMSLWRVEDEATQIWMSALYEARLDGLSTAAAMRASSRALLEDLRRRGRTTHPYFWGAFVAEGDWR